MNKRTYLILLLNIVCLFIVLGNSKVFGGGAGGVGVEVNPDININSNNVTITDNSVTNTNTNLNAPAAIRPEERYTPKLLSSSLSKGLPQGVSPIRQKMTSNDGYANGMITTEGLAISKGGHVIGVYGIQNGQDSMELSVYQELDGGYPKSSIPLDGVVDSDRNRTENPNVAVTDSTSGAYVAYVTQAGVFRVLKQEKATRENDLNGELIPMSVPSALTSTTSVRMIKTSNGINLMAVQTASTIYVATLDGTSITNVTSIASNATLAGFSHYKKSGAVVGYINSLDEFALRRQANSGSAFAAEVTVSGGDTVTQGIFTLNKKGAVAVAYLTATEITIVLNALSGAPISDFLILTVTRLKNIVFNNSGSAIAVVRAGSFDTMIHADITGIRKKGDVALANNAEYLVSVQGELDQSTEDGDIGLEDDLGVDDPFVMQANFPKGVTGAKLVDMKISSEGETISNGTVTVRDIEDATIRDAFKDSPHLKEALAGPYAARAYTDAFQNDDGSYESALYTEVLKAGSAN